MMAKRLGKYWFYFFLLSLWFKYFDLILELLRKRAWLCRRQGDGEKGVGTHHMKIP